MTDLELKEYLSRYSKDSCPDYLFLAWRILLEQVKDPNRRQVLDLAKADIEEEKKLQPQKNFHKYTRRIEGIELKPWNWGNGK